MKPRISVLLATYNRPDGLRTVLEGLTQQDLPIDDFEVVVADDGSTPPADIVARHFAHRLQIQCVTGPQGGPALARNRGLPYIRAPLTLFLNDDVIPDRALLSAHLSLHEELQDHPTAVIGTFEFDDTHRADIMQRYLEDLGLIHIHKQADGFIDRADQFCTGNLSMSTDLLHKVGGFDPGFREPKCDDIDLGLRLIEDFGLRMYFTRRANTVHDHPYPGKSWWDRSRMLGRTWHRLVEKHGFISEHFPLTTQEEGYPMLSRMRALEPVIREEMAFVSEIRAAPDEAREYRSRYHGRTFVLPRDRDAALRLLLRHATEYWVRRAYLEVRHGEKNGITPAASEFRPKRTFSPQIKGLYESGIAHGDNGTTMPIFPSALSYFEGSRLYDAACSLGAQRTFETGLGCGLSTLFLLEAVRAQSSAGHPGLHIAIDPAQESFFANSGLRNITEAGLEGWFEHLEEDSRTALPLLLRRFGPKSFDLGFIDGDHRFDAVFSDIMFALKLIRPAGLLAVDDLYLPAVRSAVSFFENNLGIEEERSGCWRRNAPPYGITYFRMPDALPERAWDHFEGFDAVA